MYQISYKELNEEELERVDGGFTRDAWCWSSYHCLVAWKHDDTGDKEAVCFSDFWCAFIYRCIKEKIPIQLAVLKQIRYNITRVHL